MHYIHHILTFILLIAALPLRSEAFRAVPFSRNFEFSSFAVKGVVQDIEGEMWFATQNWLVKYDGNSVHKFPLENTQNGNLIPGINQIFSDSNGYVWIGMSPGLIRFEKRTGKQDYFLLNEEEPLNKCNVVYDFACNSEGDLFVATRNGIFSYDPKKEQFNRLKAFAYHETFRSDLKAERIAKVILFDRSNNLWVGTEGNGLLCINLKNNTQHSYKSSPTDSTTLVGNFIESLLEDQFGKLWIGTTEGLSVFRKDGSCFERVESAKGRLINGVSETQGGDIVVATDRGLLKLERLNHFAPQWYFYQRNSSNALTSNNVIAVTTDRSGQVWLGTDKGITLLTDRRPFVHHLPVNNPIEGGGLSSNALLFCVADSSSRQVWIGTKDSGIDRYYLDSNLFQNISLSSMSQLPEGFHTPLTATLSSDGNLIVGTKGGLLQINKGEITPRQIPLKGIDTNHLEVYAVQEDSRGDLWLGLLDRGLYKLTQASGSVLHVPIGEKLAQKETYTNIKQIFEDTKGGLWVSFHLGGVATFPLDRPENIVYFNVENESLLPSNLVLDIAEKDGRLWMATANGLSLFDLDKRQFVNAPLVKLMAGVSLCGIEFDRNEIIWFSTSTQGVIRYDLTSGRLINFLEQDGLQSNAFMRQTNAQLDSFLFIGGNNGMNVINVNRHFSNNHSPRPAIINVLIDEREVSPELLLKKGGLLPITIRSQQRVSLLLSGYSYLNSWRVRYKYRIKDSNADFVWSEVNSNQFDLPNLSVGAHEIEFKASNADGLWGEPVVLLRLVVLPPLWIQFLLLFPILLLLAWIGVKWKRRQKLPELVVNVAKVEEMKMDVPEESSKIVAAVVPKELTQESILLMQELDQLMHSKQLYLNKRLNKAQLSSELRLSELQLTQLLKEHKQKGFPEYVNCYRIEAVKLKMEEPRYRDYTLWAIGEECGFNSKTSFYRVFKDVTGSTPSEFLEKRLSKEEQV